MTGTDPILAGDTGLLEALPTAIYVTDAEGNITYYNSAAAEFWGTKPELGTAKWCGSWRLFTVDGEPLPHDECPMATTLKTGVAVRGVEAFAERPDGTRIRFLPFPTLLKDTAGRITGAINLLMDVTELRQTEADSQQLAAIVSSSDDAIISKTVQGRITFWNAAASRIFGYSADEIIGKSITTIIPPELMDEEKYVLARLQEGERIEHYETVRVAKDGRRVDVSLTVSPLRDRSGKVIGASKVARDISSRKEAEKSQQLLLGELSHRVKNTLATVQAIATQSLRRSHEPGDFLTSFTGRILSLARAHDLLSETRWEGLEIGALVRDQVLFGAPDDRVAFAGPGVTLEPQAALHVAMILHELGTNARKYGALSVPRGRLSIQWQIVRKAKGRALQLQWIESGGPAVVEPSETGFGTRLIQDSLLGHRGETAIKYAAEGLTCELTLPLSEGKQSGAYAIPALSLSLQDQADRARVLGKHILVVEDEPLIAMEIEATLRDCGCEVVGPANDFDAAMRLIADDARCDAALVDTNLAGKRVDTLAAALAQAGIPFAFITGQGLEVLPPPFRDALIVSKPFSRSGLLSAMATLLQSRSNAAILQRGRKAGPLR